MDYVTLAGSGPIIGRPHAWNRGSATGALVSARDPVLQHAKSPSFHQQPAALRAHSILQFSNLARPIAGVDIMQTFRAANRDCAQQRLCRSRRGAAHLVIGTEGGDVPWNIGRDTSQ